MKRAFFLAAIGFIVLFTACKKEPISMVFVEGGTFMMGSTDTEADSDEQPLHQVVLNDFYIGKYEITQAEWKAVMGKAEARFTGSNRPMESVSWNDAAMFIIRLNIQAGTHYRLPTEAEWEYAARGGNKSKGYKYSGSNELGDVAWYNDNSHEKTHPVGTSSPNELGIYDMSGNVYEWCTDHYDSVYYANSPTNNPRGAIRDTLRVFRGGSWVSDMPHCRVASRSYNVSYIRNHSLGLRVVRSP